MRKGTPDTQMNLGYGVNNTGKLRTAIQIQGLQVVSLASTEELSYSFPASLPYRAPDMASRQVSKELLSLSHTHTDTHTPIHTYKYVYIYIYMYMCVHTQLRISYVVKDRYTQI